MIHLPLLKSPTPPLNLPVLPGKPLTPCQQQQVDFFATPPSAGKYLPRCSSSGEYIEIQCSLQGDECWCVTEEGREVPQTRSRGPLRCPKPGLKNMVLSLFHILYHLRVRVHQNVEIWWSLPGSESSRVSRHRADRRQVAGHSTHFMELTKLEMLRIPSSKWFSRFF